MLYQEDQFLPFTASPLPPGPWLVFAPHPDDETFGMGGTLARAAAEGVPAEVVIMTDGALGGSQENLVSIRQREAEQAAAILGLNGLSFLGAPDRGLAAADPEPLLARMQTLIQQSRAATVFFPGVMEPHPDHRATALLAWQVLGRIPLAQRPLPVAYEITVQNPINQLVDISGFMVTKLAAVEVYLSQLGENNYAELVKALNRTRTLTLGPGVSYAEGFLHHDRKAADQSLGDITLAAMARLLQSAPPPGQISLTSQPEDLPGPQDQGSQQIHSTAQARNPHG